MGTYKPVTTLSTPSHPPGFCFLSLENALVGWCSSTVSFHIRGGGEALPINVLLSRSRVGSMPLSKRSCQLWCAVYIDITPRMTSYAIACHRMLNALRPGPGLKMMQHHEGTCAHDVLREPERALMVVLCPPPPPKTGGTKQPHLASVLSRSNSAIEFVLTCVIPMTSH